MKLHSTLTICMFTWIAVAACDPALDGVDLDLRDQHEQLADLASERLAADVADAADAADVADAMSLDPDLALADRPDVAGAACISGSVEYSMMPSGVCGGCKINGVYPGQKYIDRKRECISGVWTAWQVTGSECQDCW